MDKNPLLMQKAAGIVLWKPYPKLLRKPAFIPP
jgi:hypothetical protein